MERNFSLISDVSSKNTFETNRLNLLYVEQLTNECAHQCNVLKRINDALTAPAKLYEWQDTGKMEGVKCF